MILSIFFCILFNSRKWRRIFLIFCWIIDNLSCKLEKLQKIDKIRLPCPCSKRGIVESGRSIYVSRILWSGPPWSGILRAKTWKIHSQDIPTRNEMKKDSKSLKVARMYVQSKVCFGSWLWISWDIYWMSFEPNVSTWDEKVVYLSIFQRFVLCRWRRRLIFHDKPI